MIETDYTKVLERIADRLLLIWLTLSLIAGSLLAR